MKRVSLVTEFSGPAPKLKRTIKEFLKKNGVGNVLQTTQINSNEKLTNLCMEQEKMLVEHVKEELVKLLTEKYPDIVIGKWQNTDSISPLHDSHIIPTIGGLSKASSGYNEQIHAADENTLQNCWSDNVGSAFMQVVEAMQSGRQIAYEIQSSVESLKLKTVMVSDRKNKGIQIDLIGCLTMKMLKAKIKSCLFLDEDITRMYFLKDNCEIEIADPVTLKNDILYYVETVASSSLPSFTTLEEFYTKLRKEVDYPDAIDTFVKPAFNAQLIGTRQLSDLTDTKLEKMGITQLGLREAILKVLGK
jgi:hypothetical protein